MEKYVQARLPRPLAVQLLKLVKKCQLSQAVSRQTLRAFCTHYKVNPSAVDHFDVTDLVNTPQTWLVSTEYHRQRQTWVKEALPSQERLQQHSSTKRSLLRCGKCKKNQVDYYEMQTRGADEPMTVFAHCLHCGKRWTQ